MASGDEGQDVKNLGLLSLMLLLTPLCSAWDPFTLRGLRHT